MKFTALLLFLFIAQLTFAQSHYLFAGTYTHDQKSKGIYVYTFNSVTGETRFISSIFTENPTFLTFSADNRYVYAVNETDSGRGSISSFSFDKKGKLNYISKQLTNGDAPCYVEIDRSNKWAVVANYSGGNFSVFPILKDGSLGASVQTISLQSTGTPKESQAKSNAHSAVFSPDGHFLTVADLGGDKLVVYPFDSFKEKPVSEKGMEISTKPKSGPRHIVFNPDKPFAYLIEELSGYISAYNYKDGKFTLLQNISSHPAGYTGEIGSAAIHLSKDGKFLYASNRGGSNTISAFSVDSVSGKLDMIGLQPSGGEHPRDFTIDPSGNYLFAGNMNSGFISVFKRDRRTGLIKESGQKIYIPHPAHLLFMKVK